MAIEQLETDTFEGSIAGGGTEQLVVDIATANHVVALLDDGTSGNTPAQYTMTQEIYVPAFNDYQLYDEVTGETSRSWEDVARGARMRFTFENTSGSSANYRISVKSFKEI